MTFSPTQTSNAGVRAFSRLGQAAIFIGVLTCTNSALAEGDTDDHGHGAHAGDVVFGVHDGALELESGRIYESDFNAGLLSGVSEAPGFNNESVPADERLMAGALLGVNAISNLYYWDGSSFADPGIAAVEIEDALFNTFTVDGNSQTSLAFTMLIGQADALGEVHTHLDFSLTDGVTGAYGIVFELVTNQRGVSPSESFGVLFNNGLEEAAFEMGVDAFTAEVAPVPVPAAIWLMASATTGLLAVGRRRFV